MYVEGRIHGHSWKDADGVQRAATEIVIDDMSMLDTKKPETHLEVVAQPENQQAATAV